MTTHKSMTFYATVTSRSGLERRIPISLPYISAIADEEHYQEPEPIERRERGPNFTEGNIRKLLGRHKKQGERLRNQIQYEHVVKRILKQGY
jgi:hypothetical protein